MYFWRKQKAKTMKKIILTGLLGVFAFGVSNAQSILDLPKNAQGVLNEHYKDWKVERVNIDRDQDDRDEMYEVRYENGTKIDFNDKGEITEIKGNKEIPAELLPMSIRDYVNKKFPEQKVTEWEWDDNEHEVELSDGTELEFDKNGKFLEENKFLGIDW